MERTKARTVAVGVFDQRSDAQRAVRELKNAGFTDEQIGVVAQETQEGSNEDSDSALNNTSENKSAEGAAAGAVAGAGVGALWAMGIAAGILPAIGPVVAGGLLGSILLSAAGGAAVAGIAGALIGLGIPEEEARYYEHEFRGGRTIVTVRANGRYNEAVDILERNQGFDMTKRSQRQGTMPQAHGESCSTSQPVRASAMQSRSGSECSTGTSAGLASGAGARTSGDRQTVALHDEELQVHKRPIDKGEVRVHKEVTTEHKTVQVPVTREEVVIEHHPAGERAGSCSNVGEQQIRIPVKEEEVDVQKRAVVREEVSVGKRKVQETKQVSGDIRHEQLKVDNSKDAKVEHVRR